MRGLEGRKVLALWFHPVQHQHRASSVLGCHFPAGAFRRAPAAPPSFLTRCSFYLFGKGAFLSSGGHVLCSPPCTEITEAFLDTQACPNQS